MTKTEFEIKDGRELPCEQVVELYNSVGWLGYTTGDQKAKLQQAIHNSTYVLSAWSGEKLIGLARCISDDVSIFYLQDILIHPEYHRQGLGRKMLLNCLHRFEHVRMKVLLTDDEKQQKKFYQSLGYKNIRDLNKIKLNAFVQIAGLELE